MQCIINKNTKRKLANGQAYDPKRRDKKTIGEWLHQTGLYLFYIISYFFIYIYISHIWVIFTQEMSHVGTRDLTMKG